MDTEYYSSKKQSLLDKHRDSYYLVELIDAQGNPTDGTGDCVLRTSIAALAMTFEGDSVSATALISAIRDHCWDQDGNPIRHPEAHWKDVDGNDLGLSPLSVDSFVALMTACDYLFASPDASVTEKARARDTLFRYVDYLRQHDWRLQHTYSDGFIDDRVKDTPGSEAFIVLPPVLYALRGIAASMGYPQASWWVWGASFGEEVMHEMIDKLATFCGQHLYELLRGIDLSIKFDVQLGDELVGLADFLNKVVPIHLSDELCQKLRDSFSDSIRESMRVAGPDNLPTEPYQIFQGLLRQFSSYLPPPLTQLDWFGSLTDLFATALPWMKTDMIMSAAAFAVALDTMTVQFSVDDPKGYYRLLLVFWPLLSALEREPELRYFLEPHLDSLEISVALKHHMGLFVWLKQDLATVEYLLTAFEHNQFDKVANVFEQSIGSQQHAINNSEIGRAHV